MATFTPFRCGKRIEGGMAARSCSAFFLPVSDDLIVHLLFKYLQFTNML